MKFSLRPVSAFGMAIVLLATFMFGRLTNEPLAPGQSGGQEQPLFGSELIDNSAAAYLLGRGLLEMEKDEAARPLLRKAAVLDPTNPEYALWEGIAHWTSGERSLERSSYRRGLQVQPDYIPLLLNLGHSYLGDGNYDEALKNYQAVLQLDPEQDRALYNSGLIFRKLQRVDEEMQTWKMYLRSHRLGKEAFRAVARLNGYGDFTFRTYRIGPRRFIISPPNLYSPFDQDILRQELEPVVALLQNNPSLSLEVVVFVEDDRVLARQRATFIKQSLLSFGGISATRVKLSWLDSPEVLEAGEAGSIELRQGLLLFSGKDERVKPEVAI